MPAAAAPALRLHVHGADVSVDRVVELGQQFCDLVDQVAAALGADRPTGIRVVGVRLCCDGCDLQQPAETSRAGWVHRAGDDFCPECVLGGGR